MPADFAPFHLSVLITACPDKAFRILLTVRFIVNRTMAIFIMIGPEIAVPVDFHFACEGEQRLATNARCTKERKQEGGGVTFVPDAETWCV